MEKLVAAVHEEKKPFKCDSCDYHSSLKIHMKKHIALVHEEKKPFKCDICDYNCSLKIGDITNLKIIVHFFKIKQVSVVMWFTPRPPVRESRVRIPSQHGNLVKFILVWVFLQPQ